ncbi:hypothetical protein FAZ69_08465 [Trinickia terrae]|uniref:Uncharacterized protein n=1 Tax=Trinickia terrae TaxID=2571161 RepID=A0A4U1I9Z6_9BURK|nr:hypothetical protein FAZ69_08465 [Trinickia terrae]
MFAGAGAAWASCGGTEALVNKAAAGLAGTIIGAISAATGSITALDEAQTEELIGSIKVLTKQVQTSTSNSDDSTRQAEEAGASFQTALATNEVINKMVLDLKSQGYDPCAQASATKQMATAEAQVTAALPQRIAAEVQAGGGRYGDLSTVLRQREQQHKALFCTQAEVTAGLCSSLGAVPGGDSNASLIFSSDTSPNMLAAKNAAINNIIGMPDALPPAGSANTPQGQAYLLAKKQKDAFLAFPAYSLKAIQSDAEGFDSFMSERVGQYFGTDRAAQWAHDQASEAERGVLVDTVKIEGLLLKLHERQLKQSLRAEADQAAELALENKRINGQRVEAAQMAVAAANARSKVAP